MFSMAVSLILRARSAAVPKRAVALCRKAGFALSLLAVAACAGSSGPDRLAVNDPVGRLYARAYDQITAIRFAFHVPLAWGEF